jgi:transposase-like protein
VDLLGRLSNPAQRRLSPADVDDLIATYRAGATIRHLAAEFGIHRTAVAAHLDRHQIPRHRERTAWERGTLEEAAELYASGLSLADVADQFGIDAQTVANRLRRAGVAVRPRRGRPSPPV